MNLGPELRRLVAEHARWRAELGRAPDGEGRIAHLLALWEREIVPHCRREEEVLLPELSARLSEADAAVVFTLGDHAALRHLARTLRESANGERVAALAAFERKLRDHFAFEERTLFPAAQEALGSARLGALAAELVPPGARRAAKP